MRSSAPAPRFHSLSVQRGEGMIGPRPPGFREPTRSTRGQRDASSPTVCGQTHKGVTADRRFGEASCHLRCAQARAVCGAGHGLGMEAIGHRFRVYHLPAKGRADALTIDDAGIMIIVAVIWHHRRSTLRLSARSRPRHVLPHRFRNGPDAHEYAEPKAAHRESNPLRMQRFACAIGLTKRVAPSTAHARRRLTW